MAPTVANIRPQVLALAVGSDIAALVPSNFAEVMQIADVLAKSEMVPAAYKGKPANCVVAMMFGMEVGLPPLASLQHVAVVNGRPTLYGDGQLAVAMGKGQLEDIEEKVEGDGEAMKAVCRLKRRGIATEALQVYSVADAKKAGLWGKTGPWTQHPKRMLTMRARAFALRGLFADHLLGISAEEAKDAGVGPDNARDVTGSVEQAPRASNRLDALETAIEVAADAPMPADETFGLPATDAVNADGEIIEDNAEPKSEEVIAAEAWVRDVALPWFPKASGAEAVDKWLKNFGGKLAQVRAIAPDAAMEVVMAADARKKEFAQ